MTRFVAMSAHAVALSLVLLLGFCTASFADQEDTDTGVEGTDGPDVIDSLLPLSASALVITDKGETVTATATGIDAKGGDDTITSSLTGAFNSDATATAVITQDPKETEAIAKSKGVVAGDGGDSVNNSSIINALGNSIAAYGNALEAQPPEPPGGGEDATELDVSVKAKTELTGIEGGDGNDSVDNAGALTFNGLATSGGSADELSATVPESATVKSKAESEVEGTGIQGGAGNDTITNDGIAETTATATSGALAISVVAPGDSTPPAENKANLKTESSATSKATVTGVHADEAELENENEDSSPFGVNGLSVTYQKTETAVSGDDEITNNALLTGNATATSGAGAASVSYEVDGSVGTEAKAEAEATATGVNAGGGNDRVDNNGELLSTAVATSGALAVAVEVGAKDDGQPAPPGNGDGDTGDAPKPPTPSSDKEGKSSTETSATAKAAATGISADGDARAETTSARFEIDDGALRIDYETVVEFLAGQDTVTNSFGIQAFGIATSLTESVGVTIASGGSAEAKANAAADAYAGAVTTGAGNDMITNSGLLTTAATATATAVSVGVAVGQPQQDAGGGNGDEPPTPTTPDKITSKTETSVTAKARGVGIDADGPGENLTKQTSVSIGVDGLSVSVSRDSEAVSGDDTVTNLFGITADSSAEANSVDASIQIEAVGSVNSESKATAESAAVGVATGAGADVILNQGALLVGSSASADSLSFGLTASKPPAGETPDGEGNNKPDKTNVNTEASATATATAAGIDAEGKDHRSSYDVNVDISGNGLNIDVAWEKESLGAIDDVTNTGLLTSTAEATSGAVSAGISINAEGSVNSEANAKATATADGIQTGGAGDTVDNQGDVDSDALATATALAVSVSVAQPTNEQGEKPSFLDQVKDRFSGANTQANAEATAQASGIDTEGAAGLQTNSVVVNMGSAGLTVDVDREFTSAAGADVVTNSGNVDAFANALTGAGAVDVKVETEGTASAEAKATSKAAAGGVLTGGGADEVTNSGTLQATAGAEAGSVAVSFTQPDGFAVKSKAESTSIADAQATGIGADGGDQSRILDSSLSVGASGVDFSWRSENTAVAETDTVTNTGDVTATATTLSGAGSGAVSMDGAAKADAKATSTSQAIAVDVGGGNDVVDSEGTLVATADAISGAVALGFGQQSEEKSKPKVEVEAGATSEATATGIAGDSGADKLTDINVAISADGLSVGYLAEQTGTRGNDDIQNRGDIDADALAAAGGLGVTVAIDGTAKADVNATAKSTATGVEAAGGDDFVYSEGTIDATADSAAVALAVGVGKKTNENSSAKTKVEANTLAKASATGIAGDGGRDDTTRSFSLDINDAGLTVEYLSDKTAAAGDDELTNRGTVNSDATATTGTVSVAVTIDGSAQAESKSLAAASAAGLDSGGGADVIDNSGTLGATADATSATLNVAVTSDGNAVSNAGLLDGGNKAEARAVGIDSAGSEHQQTTTISGAIDFNAIDVEARYEAVTDSLTADGVDDITNTGQITATSTALAPEVSAGITGEGIALSIGRTAAEATAGGIEAGAAGDKIDNSGQLTVDADSTAILANVAVAGKGLAVAANSVWDGGTKAEATASGIDADTGSQTTKVIEAKAASDVAYVRYIDEFQAAAGDDEVVNSGQIDATATALAPSLSVAVEPGKENKVGIAAAVSTSSAEAKTNAIRGGDGADNLENSGLLNATADATALSANVAVVNKGVAAAADAVWDGGTKAEAEATGIAGDGGDRSRMTRLSIGTDDFGFTKETVAADGADRIDNSGEINADSTANAGSVGVAVAAKGVGVATSTATAESRAAAIDAGGGDSVDDVYNSGKLSADSIARAAAASVSVTNEGLAISADSVWDGGTKATAESRGIDLGAGAETLTNDGQIDTTADATTLSASVAVTMKGVAGASATATGKADAVAIDASEGDDVDTIINNGELSADAVSRAAAASVSVANQGLAIASGAVWDGGTGAESVARGIDVGSGADDITNTGKITTTTDATAAEAAVGVAVQGVAGAIATSTGDSRATAIYAGAEDDAAIDTVNNTGDLTADATANAVTAAVSVTTAGVAVAGGAVWDGGTTSEATARGIETGGGGDTIDNSGAVDALSTARVAELSAAVAVNGVAGATATSTGISSATAIHAGDGDASDTVINDGDLTVDADTIAATAAVGVTTAGVGVTAGAVWDGGTKAISSGRGIDVGEGADTIENQGDITVETDSAAAEVAVSVAVTGVAGAIATSTGQSDATAIDAGDGEDEDTVTNSGDLKADAFGLAVTGTVGVTTAGVAVAGDSVWDGGTTADTRARGIETGLGKDTVTNTGAVDALANSNSASAAVSVAVSGVAGAAAVSEALSDAVAIDLGPGSDAETLNNSGKLNARADSLATAASVTVTTAGVAGSGGAVWDGGTTADGRARGIATGAGGDTVHNEGDIDAIADVESASAAVSVAVAGVGVSVATSTGLADATGIDVSEGNDIDDVYNSGAVDAEATALAGTATVSVTPAGVAIAADSVWDGGTTAESRARGIEVGEGADTIENDGSVNSTATSGAASASVAVAVAGVAGATASSTSTADSVALDSGADESDDEILNKGEVGAYADAIAASAAVSFTAAGVAISGDAAWDGGTTAEGNATAMNLGSGADTVISDGVVTADSLATATGITASVAVAGVAGAVSAATARADATAIDLGDGDDMADTADQIVASSVANANTVSNADAKFGVTVAGNNAWDGGTTAIARSSGIAAGTGVDTIDNQADITSSATTVAPSAAVTFAVGGVGAAISTATGDAAANAIDGGEGNDRIENTGNVTVDADAVAVAVNTSITGAGAGVAADAVWDGGTTSQADARAIVGGDGDDVILTGAVDDPGDGALMANGDEPADPNTVIATADSTAVSSSTAITGVGLSVSTTTATANADASGVDAGIGDDLVISNSNVTGSANATAEAFSVSITGAGVAGATDSFWDGGTKANADAKGLSGGDGVDTIVNQASVLADADAKTVSVAVAATLQGMAGGAAASTATGTSTGLAGGAGDDMLRNERSVHAKSRADGQGVSVAATLGGIAVAGGLGAETTAAAMAAGLAGGADNDSVGNAQGADVRLESLATTVDTAVAVSLQGIAVAQANAESTADAVGLSGGAGDDELINDGSIATVRTAGDGSVADGAVQADSIARSVSVTLLGAAVATADATATASAAGVRGDDGADLVVNNGSIDLASLANSEGQSISVGGVGISISDASATSNVTGSALEGGEGVDTLVNSGTVTITNSANTTTRSISAAGLGVALGSADSIANAAAGGASGGAGNDILTNTLTGTIDVNAKADVVAQGAAVSVAGFAEGSAKTLTGIDAVGMAGDGGADTITNEGNVTVNGESRSFAASASATAAGATKAKAGTEVETRVVGIAGGDGEDAIANRGSLHIGPTAGDQPWMARLETEASSFGFIGSMDAESGSFAATESIGIDGGNGDDEITNEAGKEITVVATALSRSKAGSGSIFGSAEADARSGAITEATGLAGGAGSNKLNSFGKLTVDAESRLVQESGSSFTFGGTGDVGATMEANTRAVGLQGGEEQDTIRTDGEIRVTATSTLDATGGGSSTIFGTSDLAVSTGAKTRTFGIDGAAGDDDIENLAGLILEANSDLLMSGTSYTLGGTGDTGGALAAATTVDGILGGDGMDRIVNGGDIDIDSIATLDSFGKSEATFGTSAGTATSGGIVEASGLRGGAANDYIENKFGASIDIDVAANVITETVAYTFGGGSTTDNLLTGEVDATGITGDSGADTLLNAGDITLVVTANLKSDGGSKTSIGGGTAVGRSEAAARAVGMDGGDEDDDLTNDGVVDVTVKVVADAIGDTQSGVFVGDAETGAVTFAKANAVGLSTGEGANETLTNSGLLLVEADATGYALGYASGRTFSLGNDSTTVGESTAEATAIGIEGGAGATVITNDETLDIKAQARTAKQLETVFRVYRLQGQNSEEVEPDSSLIPEVVLELPNLDENDPDTGEPNSDKYPVGTIVYCTGGLADCVPNPDVNRKGNYHEVIAEETDEYSWQYDGMDAPPPAPPSFLPDLMDPDNQDLYPDGTILYCDATQCVADDNPNDNQTPAGDPFAVEVETIVTPGWQVFAAVDDLPDLDDPAQQELYPEGTVVACKSAACTRDPALVGEDAEAAATYYEVKVSTDDSVDPPSVSYSWQPFDGRDVDGMRIEGLEIQVDTSAEAESFPSYAAANGNGLGGTGNATGNSRATATAWGLQLGDARDDVTNSGNVNVEATAEAAFAVAADGDNFGDATGKAFAFGTATAVGFDLGGGDNVLTNSGDLTVLAQPSTQSFAEASGGDLCIWFFGWWCGGGGKGFGTAETTLVAAATGITSGDGADTITNTGSITVTAEPMVRTDDSNGEFVADVRKEDSEDIKVFVTSRAVGIETGAGDDDITNNGSLVVEARDLLSGCQTQGCINLTRSKGIDSSTVEAFGILTGAGNDILRNNGLVSAQVVELADNDELFTRADVAIDLGENDDELHLGEDSTIIGSVSLGPGDDSLFLSGNPKIEDSAGTAINPAAGAGTDNLVIRGLGRFDSTPEGFEITTKTGGGTYELPALTTMQVMTVEEGTLALDSGYVFAAEGEYYTTFYADGRNGKFYVDGDTVLGGAIEVTRQGDTFIRGGTRYGLIEATGMVTEAFASSSLPEPKPLLSFELDQQLSSLDLLAVTAPFESVTKNPFYARLAKQLNRIADSAEGDLATVFGALQNQDDGFDRSFASFSPDAHQVANDGARQVIQQTTGLLQTHLRHSRELYRNGRQITPAAAGLSLSRDTFGNTSVAFAAGPRSLSAGNLAGMLPATAGAAAGLAAPRSRSRSQAWVLGLMSRGDYDEVDGYTGFDQDTDGFTLGYDLHVAEGWVLGISAGQADTELDMDDAFAETDIDGWHVGFYGTWFSPAQYLEWGVAYNSQDIDSRRLVDVGGIRRVADSSHDGEAWSAFVGGGWEFDFDVVYVEPYANLQYIHFDEDGFTESGAGSLNQVIADRDTDALFGELGAGLGQRRRWGDGDFEWRLFGGLNYDFDIDDGVIDYGYAGSPGNSFSLDGRDTSEVSGILGAGIGYTGERLGVSLDYRGRFNSDYDEHTAGAMFSVRF